ncbi:hypothetical protein PTSG_04359 [Salpingoeca rosetta]|uniref:Uncharacterized protein n=1 Tax=Salpingoeca rosetta (strain ATCC 50818 / BSB-021) TaxID=946362 RepID=F2U8B6_SALR5|nr:uncharacterized protein PTSG_04359 [Salpingoeca rosetta]EGD72624.1 hypothetical protein PTSG_04359 [Salpingoeca rosetta]|eukprot:XP_004994447.1 hypothetical protein PTSG_04359 [Salpingoeca rosetta]
MQRAVRKVLPLRVRVFDDFQSSVSCLVLMTMSGDNNDIDGANSGSGSTGAAGSDTGGTATLEDFGDWGLEDDGPKRPACFEFFGRWKRCTTAVNQLKSYYIYGEIDSCQEEWQDLKECLKCKVQKPAVAAERWEAYTGSKKAKEEAVSPVGTIWPTRTEEERPDYGGTHDTLEPPRDTSAKLPDNTN